MNAQSGVLTALLLGLTSPSVKAGDLYTIRTADGVLQHFDTRTLTFTDVGPLGAPFDFGDLAFDANSQTMYMVQGLIGTGLYTVDLSSGAATLVGSHGSERMFGLTCDATTGKMYCGESTGSRGFFEIDPATAELTLIATININVDGMMFDPVRQMIVAGYAGPGDLHSIDPIDGTTERIYNGGYFDNCGLAFDPDTGLYWLIDWGGNVMTYDPNNGYQQSLVLSGVGPHDGFVAAPRDPVLYSLRLLGTCPGPITLSWEHATPNRQQGVVFGRDYGQTTIPPGPCQGTTLGLSGSVRLVMTIGTAGGSGSLNGQSGRPVCGGLLQLVESSSCRTSNVAAIR